MFSLRENCLPCGAGRALRLLIGTRFARQIKPTCTRESPLQRQEGAVVPDVGKRPFADIRVCASTCAEN